jgi:hypothetical protein
VLVSCINPRIWRVAVVPELPGNWTCSSEFVVLRPRKTVDSWSLAVALHHPSVRDAVQRMAGGTSSSRQRVPKHLVPEVSIPVPGEATQALKEHASSRTQFYRMRLQEADAYRRLHEGVESIEIDTIARTT